jgi:hypothetical protein
MLLVLGAIDATTPATLVKVSALTALDKKTVTRLIASAQQQAGVVIDKNNAVYTITNWGPVLKRSGCRLALAGGLEG